MSAVPQHMVALDRANIVRFERSAVRARVKDTGDPIASRHMLADIITQAPLPACMRTLMLEKFLLWGYRIYPRHRQGCYELADVSPHRPLGSLSPRQRQAVADALRMPVAQLEEARKLHAWQLRQNTRAA